MAQPSVREAMGQFATGVAVVTTSVDGCPVGVTVNSFSSVSLNPPLVLWSLSKSSRSLSAYANSGSFAINILAEDQLGLSRRFAQRRTEKFIGIDFVTNESGVPLLAGCSARFQCETVHQYDGGDHVIFVGEIKKYDVLDKSPLLFHRGAFYSGRDMGHALVDSARSAPNSIGFTEDFFPYLLARAHFQLNEPIQSEAQRFGIDGDDCFVLLLLSIGDGRSLDNLCEALAHTSHHPSPEKIAGMHERGLINIVHREGVDRIYVSTYGDTLIKKLLSASREVERKLQGCLGVEEAGLLRVLLKNVISRTDPGVPDLWDVGGEPDRPVRLRAHQGVASVFNNSFSAGE